MRPPAAPPPHRGARPQAIVAGMSASPPRRTLASSPLLRRSVGLALGLLAAACAGPRPVAARGARFDLELFVLGVAQDGGLPHLGCERSCCREARHSGRRALPACLGLHDRESGRLLLVEATPAIEAQVARLHELAGAHGRGRRVVDGVVVTHAHIGHYLGLAQLGREVAATRELPLWVTPRMAAFLRENGPWSQLVTLRQVVLREHAPGETFTPLEGLRITPIAVPHRDEFSDTVALRIRGPRRTVLFAPDVDHWGTDGALLRRLLDGVDVAYLDGTFYDGRELPDRSLEEIPHPPMVVTMRLLAGRARERPGAIRFVHLNHTNPALHDPALRARIERAGFRLARPGERVEL